MMRLTFLGTGGSTPTKLRSLPSVALEYDGDIYLFDCGEGTQRQIMINDLNISKVEAIFITHSHGDHIIGVAGLVRTLALNQRTRPLYIFVPEGDEKRIGTLLTFDKALIGYKIVVKGVKMGEVYKGKDFTVSAFKLNHTVSTYGYLFKENDKIHFIKDKSAKAGLKGEMFSELLKKGRIKIKNKIIKLKDITTSEPGKKIIYATDTRPSQNTIKAASGADILIHESSYLDDLKNYALARGHSTALEAAEVAKKAKCKKLILFHTSSRYKDTTVLEKEARKIFKNTQVSTDGMQITL